MHSKSQVHPSPRSGRSSRTHRISTATIGATLAGAFTIATPGVAAAQDTLDPHCDQVEQTVTCVWGAPSENSDGYAFTVPANATDISVTAIGGAGASGKLDFGPANAGGAGAIVPVDYASAGEFPSGDGTLVIVPGAKGGMANGVTTPGSDSYSGYSGAGGSASIVTTDGNAPTSDNTVVFAAGGGGGGGTFNYSAVGPRGGDGAGFDTLGLPDLTGIGTGGHGGAGGLGDTSGGFNSGGRGGEGLGHGGDGGYGGRSGVGNETNGPGGDGGQGGDGGDGYGGHGGHGGGGEYRGGADGLRGGDGGDGYGAQGGSGSESSYSVGPGGDGGTGGLSYIHGVSTLTDGVWNVVGEPTYQAPGVTLVYTVPSTDDSPDEDAPQTPPLFGSLLGWAPVIALGSLATGSAS